MTTNRMTFEKGDLVWFDPGIGHVLPGEVVEFHRAGQVITIQALINGKAQIFTMDNLATVKRRQDLGQYGVEDMIQISDLNEASLLWNLKIRYDVEKIYTYTGSILVAVNPYKMFDIYGLDMVKKYEGQILGTLPPHLFAIGSAAYGKMSKDQENQVVVISGESGAGKTESTKLVMQYLAAVNKSPSNLITEQILEASPLLESFGNAKTIKNDNSSRFGKYLEVHFKDGVITGAKITEYLLEKSRIVTQAPEERNYHVFYEMLRGLGKEQKDKYGLLSAEKYFYLNQGGNCEIDGKYDGEDYQSLLSAMQVLGFTMEEQDTIFRILASVLHLGNVYFHRKALKHGQEGVEIGSDAEVKWTSHLLHLSVDGIKKALTMKTTEARNERVMTPLNIDQALDARDAIAKALYSSLFTWLVSRINQIVYKAHKKTSISILDIFGFEDFKENSFEQLCINYANENLQYYFNKHIFRLEQQEYAKEKIEWQTISYQDNQPVISLISRKPVGIFHLLDDESNFPKATDVSFLEKCHYNHALNELYSRPRLSGMEFGVKHYAGQVWYNVDGFLDKNRDTLRHDVMDLLISSKVPMISRMFQELRVVNEAAKTVNKSNGRFVTMKPRTPTVAARFHDSLQQLLESMTRCNPWFVRCVKPNNEKAAMKLDLPLVLEQLRYTGMLETIRIRKMGYPIRMKFVQFADRYRCLIPGRIPLAAPSREICRVVLDRTPNSHEQYQLGLSKLFLRESLEQTLERERFDLLTAAAIQIQRMARGFVCRKRYQSMRRGTVRIQAHVRGWVARRKYQKLRKGVIVAQATFRMRTQMKKFKKKKVEVERQMEAERVARERAKVKAQRDEAERISRAVAGVNHLEIPAELAFIFSKLDDWQEVHTERNLVKVVGPIPELPVRGHLPHDIDYHAFTKFTNVYFKSHLWGMKREPIKTPFLAKAKDMDYQDSLAIFKLILRFMNDNNLNGKKETTLGNYIINKGLINEKLRDEIFCQLCNQTWKNENEQNCGRGWLLLSNCISVFPPSKTLYKYLLKYVSDNAYNGYKALCQHKLLQSARVEAQLCRNYPPCLLEWRANRKKTSMALEAQFSDGKSKTAPVESWTTGEEFASLLVGDRGVAEDSGWTVSLHESSGSIYELNGCDYVLDLLAEMELAPAFPVCKNFFLVSNSKGDPPKRVRKSSHDPSIEMSTPSIRVEKKRSMSREEMLSDKITDRYYEEKKIRSRSLDNLLDDSKSTNEGSLQKLGLSQSKLNARYRSSDKAIDMPLSVHNQSYITREEVLEEVYNSDHNRVAPYQSQPPFGLSKSSLNGRYFVQASDFDDGGHDVPSDSSSDVSDQQRHMKRRTPNDMLKRTTTEEHLFIERSGGVSSLNGGRMSPEERVTEEMSVVDGNNSEFDYPIGQDRTDDKTKYPRYIKAASTSKRSITGSHSSRAYIETRFSEKSEYGGTKSSALSDTSEAPSLASHVRRVRVPSQASDVDQFLDDLFMPVLDGNLDELSDARSLAASIKGGKKGRPCSRDSEDREVESINTSLSSVHGDCGNVDEYISDLFRPIFVGSNLNQLSDVGSVTEALKGGGRGVGGVETQTSQNPTPGTYGFSPLPGMTSPPPMLSGMVSPPPMMIPNMQMFGQGATNPAGSTATSPMMFPFSMPYNMSVPIYNMQGFTVPPTVDNTSVGGDQVSAYQQNLQRAFIQSAMAQNIQIQQQLLQQNQALQQLLQQQAVSFQEPDKKDHWEKQSAPQSRNITPSPFRPHSRPNSKSNTESPNPYSRSKQDIHQVSSSPSYMGGREGGIARKSSHHQQQSGRTESPQSIFGCVLSELRSRRSSVDSESPIKMSYNGHGPPPPPPLPPDPDMTDPSIPRPFLDPYGRAKTVRIGKWRWPPPVGEQEGDEFINFKMRHQQHQHISNKKGHSKESSPVQSSGPSYMVGGSTIDWDEFDTNDGRPIEEEGRRGDAKEKAKLFEVATPKPSVGSVGKLRISNEMRQKLEMVTSNHSVRSGKSENKRSFLPVAKQGGKEEVAERAVKKLEENRKLMLQMQLGGGKWDSVTSVEDVMRDGEDIDSSQVHVVRHQVERMEKSVVSRRPLPPPLPVTPSSLNSSHQLIHSSQDSRPHSLTPRPLSSTPRPLSSNSSYLHSSTNGPLQKAMSPPPPIQPVINHRKSNVPQRNLRIEHERRSSVLTQHTDRIDRIEIEESSEFLNPIDMSPPVVMDRYFVNHSLESIKTKLHPLNPHGPHFTYNRVTWKLHIRKEVFSPTENVSNPLALHLIFCQIVQDTFNINCIRISREERNKMKQMLEGYGVSITNLHTPQVKVTLKKNIIDMAKEWPTYFSRLFPVTGGRHSMDIQLLGISHSGIRFIRREKSIPSDYLQVLDTISFEDIMETSVPKGSLLQVILHSGTRHAFYTHRANQIRQLIDRFMIDSSKGSQELVRAVSDYVTRESTLLSFRRGDVIRVVNKEQYLEKGWLYGILDGRSGIFPVEYVENLTRQEQNKITKAEVLDDGLAPETADSKMALEATSWTEGGGERGGRVESNQPETPGGDEGPTSMVHDGRHSLLQFAMQYFRQSPEKFEMLRNLDGTLEGSLKMIESLKNKKGKGKKGKDNWTWKELVDMVKFSHSPIDASLLRVEPAEMNKLSIECFIAIMRYMGDYPMMKGGTEVECVYTILRNCHKHPALRDEVYCQMMKQTTNNKSARQDSCQRGWRLFSILGAYFNCSDTLKSYLFKYLETAAYDKRRAYHGTALVCLKNLRKTLKYGGRRNVPSVEEITAITAGRNSKRQIYRLPGGTQRVINTKSTTVVHDIIEELCGVINVRSSAEMEEFSLYCIVEGDTFTMPLAREEYVLDVTTELHKNQQVFYLIFCRSVWYHPLRLDNALYIEVAFNQVVPDYLEGLLLVMPQEQMPQEIVYEMCKLAALLHVAAGMMFLPTLKETKYLLPKPALAVRDIKPPQWVGMVQESWREVEGWQTSQAKAHILEILQKWPLFGSSFFAVKRVSEPIDRPDYILALNHSGVHFLDLITHETLIQYPFSEVISTRKVKSEDGTLFLDMKMGNLMQQRITRIQTDQAHEISRLIRQYITIEQRNRGGSGLVREDSIR